MGSARQVRDWLSWLVKVRILVITLLLVIELFVREIAPWSVPIKYFLSLILFWYTLSLFYAILQATELDPYLQAYVQLVVDLVVVTGIVYVTGSLDSYLITLYLLVIIVASILLSRVGAFLLTALAFLLFAFIVVGPYANLIPSLYPQPVTVWPLQMYLGINLLAFCSVWYLSSQLAESLRKTGVALEDTTSELEDLQVFNENIIQSMRGGLLTTNLEGRILLLNPAGADILEVSPHAVRGALMEEEFPEMARLKRPVGDEPGRTRMELRVRTGERGKKVKVKILGASVSLLRTREGAAGGYVYNFQDLTDLKHLEAEVKQKERMATLGRMAAALAHEIRNPLGAIAGSVRQLARYAQVGEDEGKLVEIVNRESERLNRVVNDILSYSKSKAPKRESTDLIPVLEDALLLLERHPQFNGKIRVEKRLPPRGVRVPVDAGQIKQVFWNLFDNALRAMPDGGTLRVALEKGEGVVRVRVADTGMGLSPEQCEKIFEPFESSFPGGTGLGLAIVNQIVQGHGGHVWAAPGQPRGSEFTVELPA